MKVWVALTILITVCSVDSETNFENSKLLNCNCNHTNLKIRKGGELLDSLVHVIQIFKGDTTKFILCNKKFSDINEQADHILIWNSRPIKRYENSFKYSYTKTVLNSDSLRQIDYFAQINGHFCGFGLRLMLNKNTKKIYVNNNCLISNKYITLDQWCKWADMPDLPE